MTDPYDLIDEEGNCLHHWVFVGSNDHGEYYRCSRCGEEGEL